MMSIFLLKFYLYLNKTANLKNNFQTLIIYCKKLKQVVKIFVKKNKKNHFKQEITTIKNKNNTFKKYIEYIFKQHNFES